MELQIFENGKLGSVRVAGDNENPLFCLSDVCKVLELSSPHKVKKAIEIEFGEGGELTSAPLLTNGGVQQATFITEPQLYFVLMRSDKPKAKPFRQWVVGEILPSIRKHGAYMTKNTMEQILENPDFTITLIEQLKTERQERQKLETEIKENAGYLAFAKGVECSQSSVNVGVFSKMLEKRGIIFGKNKLFEWLRNNKYLIKSKGREYNLPYQRYIKMGIFEISTTLIETNKESFQKSTTKITGKGQIYLAEKIIKALKGAKND
ncbi:hypothetical protein CCZ01_07830 [Helicobacter monodelphidis]|uniref:phage antirepressor n=1 Tax=Helicobacter sp. 15-1451 TaxID=2004995 RepID=UPI000DCDE9A7|nr:phage antirepressor KilAC domain-containing protein [Helicobacter sp. 15-1451]RAX56953.1 hypothetical protein CCZ01_07830 [Helicobacter sp. 15-1451]